MYIKEQDFKYFENLSKELDEKKRERFKELLVEACSEKTGKRDIGKIKVINAIFLIQNEIDNCEIVTRTMIKKAYKTAKKEKIGEKID